MKKFLFFQLLFIVLFHSNAQEDVLQKTKFELASSKRDSLKAHADSVFIYEIFKDNIETLKNATNYKDWSKKVDSINNLTACQFTYLRLYNKKSYTPIDELNKERFGTAYSYPKPSELKNYLSESSVMTKYEFSTLDKTTKFISRTKGGTLTPYVLKNYFDENGKLLFFKRLDPVTLKDLK